MKNPLLGALSRRACPPALQKTAAMIIAVFWTAAVAIAGSKVGNYNSVVGNEFAGARGAYSVSAINGAKLAKASLKAGASVQFLKQTVPGVELSASLENSAGQKRATYTVKVAGFVVDTGVKNATFKWAKVFNRTLIKTSVGFPVGPVPVTVSGTAGGGGSVGCSFNLGATSVGLSGEASAFANGSASAGVGAPVLNVALRSDLQLGKSSLRPSVTVTPSAWSGSTDLVFDPVKIDVGVVLQTKNKVWYRKDLTSYSAPSRTVSLLKL